MPVGIAIENAGWQIGLRAVDNRLARFTNRFTLRAERKPSVVSAPRASKNGARASIARAT